MIKQCRWCEKPITSTPHTTEKGSILCSSTGYTHYDTLSIPCGSAYPHRFAEPQLHWVVQRLDSCWAAGYVEGNNGFHHKFDTLGEAIVQATWDTDAHDTLTFWDERGAVIPDPRLGDQ